MMRQSGIKGFLAIVLTFGMLLATGCTAATSQSTDQEATGAQATKESEIKPYDTIKIVWYPNESGEDLKSARDEFARMIEEATGKKVEHQLTTDYNIAIETIASGNAHISFLGAQGYIIAHEKNPAVVPLVVQSGESGTLDDAKYNSWFAVKKGDEPKHMTDGKLGIAHMQGLKVSFVSNSSTSGFKVPTSLLMEAYKSQDKWKDMTVENFLEGGKDQFFGEVLFGGSHQGSAVNLLSGKVDVAAFCDSNVNNYVEVASGEENAVGAVYKVRKDAAEPFNTVLDGQFVIIASTPVLNAPFVGNTEVLTAGDIKAIQEVMTSDAVANNQKIFVPKDSEFKGMITKKKNERFVLVEDEWFNPIRELSK